MALTATEVRNETTGVDRAFVLALIKIQNQVVGISDAAAQDMAKAVMKQASATGIKDQDTLVADLIGLLGLYFVILNQTILNGQVDVARVKVATAKQQYVTPLNQAKAYDEAKKLVTELNEFPAFVEKTFAFRKAPDGQNYEGRIKTLQVGAEKTVRNIVANGVENGNSALVISKKIQRYVSPSATGPRTRPYDEFRQRFNTTRTPNIAAGSVRTNAMMIARTESAEMYRDATTRLYKNKDWIKGFRWVLSNSHPKADICDNLAAHGTYSKTDHRPFSHPHCVCDWQAERFTDRELVSMVKAGKLE